MPVPASRGQNHLPLCCPICHRHHRPLNISIIEDQKSEAIQARISSWRPFGPLDFVLRALRALRPCDPRNNDWIVCQPLDGQCVSPWIVCQPRFFGYGVAVGGGVGITYSRSQDYRTKNLCRKLWPTYSTSVRLTIPKKSSFQHICLPLMASQTVDWRIRIAF